jgi:4-hydroxy-tetrahydrodipicolinate synthase
MAEFPETVAALPTPLSRTLAPDPGALRAHLQWLASEGADGALVLGTNGEFPSFRLEERRRIAEAAASAESGLQLLLGVGSCAVDEVETLLEIAGSNGYVAALCPPPFYFRSAPRAGIAKFLHRVLDATPVPLLLYHIPGITGIPVDDELLEELAGHDTLAGVKDSSGSEDELLRLLAGLAHRLYYVGHDRLVARCREGGGKGSITATANLAPGLVAEARRSPEAQRRLGALRDLLEDFGLGQAVKAILRARGFGDYGTRPPLLELARGQERELLSRLDALGI